MMIIFLLCLMVFFGGGVGGFLTAFVEKRSDKLLACTFALLFFGFLLSLEAVIIYGNFR